MERCAQVPRPAGVVRRSRNSKRRGRPTKPLNQATKRPFPTQLPSHISYHVIDDTLYWVDRRLGDALYFWHPITSRISSCFAHALEADDEYGSCFAHALEADDEYGDDRRVRRRVRRRGVRSGSSHSSLQCE